MLALQLARLDEALCPLVSRDLPSFATFANVPLRGQLKAACFSLALAAGIVSSAAPRPPASAFQAVPIGCKLVLRSGAALLEREAAALHSRGNAVRLLPASSHTTEGHLVAEMAAMQLAAMVGGAVMASQAGHMQQFASQVAQPAALVRWLAALSRAFSAAGPGEQAARHFVLHSILASTSTPAARPFMCLHQARIASLGPAGCMVCR